MSLERPRIAVVAGNYESRSFVQDSDGTIRLYNVDSNGRWSGGRAIGDRKAFIGSGMAAFQYERDSRIRLYFQQSDGSLAESVIDPSSGVICSSNPCSSFVNPSNVMLGTSLTAVSPDNGNIYLYYQGTNGQLYSLLWTGSSWSTPKSFSYTAIDRSSLSVFWYPQSRIAGRLLRLYAQSPSGNVVEFVCGTGDDCNDGGSFDARETLPARASITSAFQESMIHVYAQDSDGTLIEYHVTPGPDQSWSSPPARHIRIPQNSEILIPSRANAAGGNWPLEIHALSQDGQYHTYDVGGGWATKDIALSAAGPGCQTGGSSGVNSSPSNGTATSSSSSKLAAAAAGSAVGGFFFGFAVAAVIFFILRRRENRRQVNPAPVPTPAPTEPGGGAGYMAYYEQGPNQNQPVANSLYRY